MSMQDPIADMFTRVRNGHMAKKVNVAMPSSTIKVAIAAVLKKEGFIDSYRTDDNNGKPTLDITLKYCDGMPVIERIKRISRPSLRVYKGSKELPRVDNGLGIAIISTPKGVMTEKAARKANLGGEVLAEVV